MASIRNFVIQIQTGILPALFIFLSLISLLTFKNISAKNFHSVQGIENPFDWEKKDIPTPPIRTKGAFTTFLKDYFIIAGGFNVDEKAYSNLIHVFDQKTNQWETLDIRLENKIGFGSTVVSSNGVYLLGGLNEDKVSQKVTYLEFNENTGTWRKEIKADMPKPIALSGSCLLNGNIYIAGGINNLGSPPTSDFYRYNYVSNEWIKLKPISFPVDISPSLVVQNDGENNMIYLHSTSNETKSLSYLGKYNPQSQSWEKLNTPPIAMKNPIGIAKEGFHVLYLPGNINNLFNDENDFELPTKTGLIYHTITNTWVTIENLNEISPTALFQIEDIIYSYQSPEGNLSIHSARPRYESLGLRFPDIIAFIAYIVLLLYIGYWFSRRATNTDEYFRGGKRVPAWAAGISVIATKLSAVTFMSIPAKVFATDWLYILIPLNGLFLAYFIVKVILPFFHRLNITSAYEYLEKRFNVVVRIIGSSTYLLWEIGRIGILLLLPAIVISVVLDIDIYLCIAMIGIVATVYTLLGGIEAVVWTDVLQVFIMFGGILLALTIMVYKTDGSIPELIQSAADQNKLRAFDFDFDFTTATVWVIMLGWIGRIQEYVSTQSIVQRFVTVKDEKEAGKSMWISAIAVIPIIIFFYIAGTALYLFYQEFPQQLNPNLEQLDAILPFFIITQLPTGIAGLVIAAIFAAAMSSLDSGIHSMSTVITTDWYKRFIPDFNEEKSFRLAKYLVVLLGIFGTTSAMLMAGLPIQSLFDQLMLIMGLFGGGLAGIFIVGMLSKRAHATGVIIGFVVSGFVQYAVSFHTDIHFLLYSVTGLVSCFVIGYLASILIPNKGKHMINAYTIYGLLKKN